MKLNIIVACDETGGIGYQGQLPWGITLIEDMMNFKRLTTGSAVVMGRKTWESIPAKHRPLSGRANYIVSRTVPMYPVQGISVYPSIRFAIQGAQMDGHKELWVIGGQSLYEEALDYHLDILGDVWITFVQQTYMCDTFFPLGRFMGIPCVHNKACIAEDGTKYTIKCFK